MQAVGRVATPGTIISPTSTEHPKQPFITDDQYKCVIGVVKAITLSFYEESRRIEKNPSEKTISKSIETIFEGKKITLYYNPQSLLKKVKNEAVNAFKKLPSNQQNSFTKIIQAITQFFQTTPEVQCFPKAISSCYNNIPEAQYYVTPLFLTFLCDEIQSQAKSKIAK